MAGIEGGRTIPSPSSNPSLSQRLGVRTSMQSDWCSLAWSTEDSWGYYCSFGDSEGLLSRRKSGPMDLCYTITIASKDIFFSLHILSLTRHESWCHHWQLSLSLHPVPKQSLTPKGSILAYWSLSPHPDCHPLPIFLLTVTQTTTGLLNYTLLCFFVCFTPISSLLYTLKLN